MEIWRAGEHEPAHTRESQRERGPLPRPPQPGPVRPGTRAPPPAPTPLDPDLPRRTKPRAGRGGVCAGGHWDPADARTGGLRTGCRCRGRGPISLETVAQGTRRAGPGATRASRRRRRARGGLRAGPRRGAGEPGSGGGARPGAGPGQQAGAGGAGGGATAGGGARARRAAGTVGKFSQPQPGGVSESRRPRVAQRTPLQILPDPCCSRPARRWGARLEPGAPQPSRDPGRRAHAGPGPPPAS